LGTHRLALDDGSALGLENAQASEAGRATHTLPSMADPNPADPSPLPRDTDPVAIHAPWRDRYMQELTQQRERSETDPTETSDFLDHYWRHPEMDSDNHVVARVGRGETAGLIVLNKYPYANGHLLVALADARPRLLEYTPPQRAALWSLTDLAVELVERTLQPQGVNVGMNQGAAAGAGLPGHLHVHVVPRWIGDVNFLAVVGRVRVIPSALEHMAERYRTVWAHMRNEASD